MYNDNIMACNTFICYFDRFFSLKMDNMILSYVLYYLTSSVTCPPNVTHVPGKKPIKIVIREKKFSKEQLCIDYCHPCLSLFAKPSLGNKGFA